MRKFVLSACMGLVVMLTGVGIGHAMDTVTMDGSWWQDVPDASRTYVTQAAMDAYQSGWINGSTAEGTRVIQEGDKISPSFGSRVFNIVYRKENGHYVGVQSLPKYSRTFGFYSSAIMDFYASRSADAMKATIGDVIGCLADQPEYTCDNVEKLAASSSQ